MPVLDVFASNAFNSVSMTDAVNRLPFKPSRIGQMNLFDTKGVATTKVAIEEKAGKLSLVPNTSRLMGPAQYSTGKRKLRVFESLHLPLESTILADAVQNVRAFGSEDQLQSVAQVVGERLGEMRQSLEVTIEHLRMGALKGIVLDADGVTVLYNLLDIFGLSAQSMSFVLGTVTTDVRLKVLELKSAIELAVGGLPMDYVHVMCSPGFFRALISHAEVKNMYLRWQDGEALRNDPRSNFTISGVVFEENSSVVGGVKFIPDNKARAFPVGVPGCFLDYRAPANWLETANTIGLPFYAKQERQRYDAGVSVQVQANPLPICTMPDVLWELTL